jgi:asparagine synthase (glutamine-hydrolysing)
MCGIAGIFDPDSPPTRDDLGRMSATLAHRGPDADGMVLDNEIGLAHRRLSILDLSDAGKQPMASHDGRFLIIFNGEIYNYLELREELKSCGYIFLTETDTEVILAAYAAWGAGCLTRFNGMWGFVIWDKKTRTLFGSRDRLGVKPFYYTAQGKRFLFASEMKALLTQPQVKPTLNERTAFRFLVHGYTDTTPDTLFINIKQLPPGALFELDSKGLRIREYWNIQSKSQQQRRASTDCDEQFRSIFTDAVRLRLRSDVATGSCLSGGLDSSSIVCTVNRLLHERALPNVGDLQKTFSACYQNPAYDERQYIDAVVAQTQVESHRTFPSAARFLEQYDTLLWHQEEPFSSLGVYSQWEVFRSASESGMKVMLDGQGGDESLLGYPQYYVPNLLRLLTPTTLGRFVAEFYALHAQHRISFTSFLAGLLQINLGPLMSPIYRILGVGQRGLRKDWYRTHTHTLDIAYRASDHLLNHAMTVLRYNGLPDLLHFEDRNSMAFSIEARLPFLDVRLVEFLFSLPVEEKLDRGLTKVILRRSMSGLVPDTILSRRDKMGFATPQDEWLRGPLRSFSESFLRDPRSYESGIFSRVDIDMMWQRFLHGKTSSSAIWRVINFLSWHKKFIAKE